MAKPPVLGSALTGLNRLPGVRGSIIAGRDGLLLTGSIPKEQAEALSALASTLYGTAEGAAESLDGVSDVEEVIIEAADGALHLMAAGPRLLLVKTSTNANLGVVRLEMRRVVETIASA